MKRAWGLPSPSDLSQDLGTVSSVSFPVPQNRRAGNISLALIPLALLGITCGFSLVQRAAASIAHPEKFANRYGKMTTDEAQKTATTLCTELTGSPASVADVSRQCAYSWKRQIMVREWNVLCDSSQGQFLVRINADSRRVYAINRMDATSSAVPDGSKTADGAIFKPQEELPVSQTLAEERAREYLRIVGVPSKGLTQMQFRNQHIQAPGSDEAASQWNFTYRRSVPGLGKRLLKVSVNGETGTLEHVWNPVLAL